MEDLDRNALMNSSHAWGITLGDSKKNKAFDFTQGLFSIDDIIFNLYYFNVFLLFIHRMKTEQIMERDLHGILIRQSTKTSYFNANDLLSLYEKIGKSERRIEDFMRTKNTKIYISAIKAEMLNHANSRELELEPYYSKRGKYGGTWMHPYLFIDFAMWLSPEFKLTCVKWIYDKLIEVRIDSGDSFKEVNRALFSQKPTCIYTDYSNEARMINKLVFDDPSGGQRNKATEKQLQLLSQLQKMDIHLIEQGLDYYDRYTKLQETKKVLQLTC